MEKHTVKMEEHVCCMEMEPWDANALKCLKEFIVMIVGSWLKYDCIVIVTKKKWVYYSTI